MIQILENFPDEILAIYVEGKITGKEYEHILTPAVEAKLKRHPKIRLFCHVGLSFNGLDFRAVVDDIKMAFQHFTDWEKMAVVSDNKFVNRIAKFLGRFMPIDIPIFHEADMAEARNWITGDVGK